ncbi:MAG: hypothetical protein RIM72_10515 [Alphaproteobacteria bacterium]
MTSVLFIVLTLPRAALAQDWVTDPAISVSTSYETNPGLNAEDERPNRLYIVNPTIVSRLEFPTTTVDFDASASVTRSKDQTVAPDTEQFDLGASGEKVFSRTSLSAATRITLEEFANSDFDDDQALSAVDVNVANEDDTILTLRLSSGMSHEVTELITGTMNFNFTSTEFSDEARADSFDYRLTNGYSYALNDVLSATTSGSVQYFDPVDDEAVVTLRVSGGANYVIDEDHSVRGSIGLVSNDEDTSFTIDWSQNQSFRYFDVTSSSVFDLAPDENGQFQRSSRSTVQLSVPVSDVTELRIGGGYAESENTATVEANTAVNHAYSEFISLSLAASSRQTENFGNNESADSKTTEIVITPTLNWIIDDEVSATARYDEIMESTDGNDSVNSRRGTISLNYNLGTF